MHRQISSTRLANRQEAVKTYMEQTKLLVTLASAFLLAPPFFFEKMDFVGAQIWIAEFLFILSVIAGYFVFGTLSGSQHVGRPDVHRPATRYLSLLQLGLFIAGIVFLYLAAGAVSKKPAAEPPKVINTHTYIYQDSCCHRHPVCTVKRTQMIRPQK